MTGVIYDFGMNNGDDVEYYLLKGARVVGVEANRSLCALAERRFAQAIQRGQLEILNVALSDRESAEPIPFYLHKADHVLSQLPRPAERDLAQFEQVVVPSRTPASIVAQFGEPLYIKIDVEHFDVVVLHNLFQAKIRPPEISAESHSVAVFAAFVAAGYNSFSLVDGSTVGTRYGRTLISTSNGEQEFSFKPHSAGPFGEDIRTPWEDADTFFHTLSAAGLGWKDIHASRSILPQSAPPIGKLLLRQMAGISRQAASRIRKKFSLPTVRR